MKLSTYCIIDETMGEVIDAKLTLASNYANDGDSAAARYIRTEANKLIDERLSMMKQLMASLVMEAEEEDMEEDKPLY